MTTLRVGTRGSDLALWQTRWVSDRLRAAHPDLRIEEIILKTHGDIATEQRFDADWPVGGFVGAIEKALSDDRIDFAVHSYKDLQTAATAGLTIAAIPRREVVHDVLVTRRAIRLSDVTDGFRLGTSSPRRSAQFRRIAKVEIVPIRGNVPTRVAKLEREKLDGVVLAAAGLKRLGIEPPNKIDLGTDRFLPAPAQGAIAIQTRVSGETARLVAAIDDAFTRRAVIAERSFLKAINAGCQVPVAALARVTDGGVALRGQLFSDDGLRVAEGVEEGFDGEAVGVRLAHRLLTELEVSP